jgi:hypothetical protein
MVSSFEIVSKIRAYLTGGSNLNSFRQWIVESQIDLENHRGELREEDRDAARLLADIEGRYAEVTRGLVSEDQWKRRLASLVFPQPLSAESFLLTYYYSVPLQRTISTSDVAANFNTSTNYSPVPGVVLAA